MSEFHSDICYIDIVRTLNMDKYTKKANTRILKEVLKYREKASGNTTYDQAFVILMEEWDMECGIENKEGVTVGTIYRDGECVHTFNWDKSDAYSEKERDWNWDFVYKNFLEHIIKTRLYKRPKVSKRELNAQKKAAELKAKEEAKAEAKRLKEEAKLAKEKEKADKAAVREAKRIAKENKSRKRK